MCVVLLKLYTCSNSSDVISKEKERSSLSKSLPWQVACKDKHFLLQKQSTSKDFVWKLSPIS